MKKVYCPSCGRNEGVPLIRGAAEEEAWKAAQRGEAVLAGCLMQPATCKPDVRSNAEEDVCKKE